MGVYAEAHLIYGYKVTRETSFEEMEDEMLEKYENPTKTEPGFIWGYDGIEYFGCMIEECGEGEESVLAPDIHFNIDISTKYKVKAAMEEVTKVKQTESPKLYLACLCH